MPDSAVIAEARKPVLQHHFADMEQQRTASSLGMWLFLATEIMLFGGMFCAYLTPPGAAAPQLRSADREHNLAVTSAGPEFGGLHDSHPAVSPHLLKRCQDR